MSHEDTLSGSAAGSVAISQQAGLQIVPRAADSTPMGVLDREARCGRLPCRREAVLAALLIIVCCVASCRGSDHSSTEGGSARVGIYADEGAWPPGVRSIAQALEAEGISVRLLRARDVRNGELGKVDALVVPGGNAWVQWQTLEKPGLDAIRGFVRGGKAYVGVCAGAYLATDEVVWEEEGTTDYPLDLFDGVARGALDEIAPWPGVASTRLTLTDAGRDRGLSWPDDADFYYQGGPAFSGLDDAEVLASYPGGEPAIVAGTFGRGRVTLTAVHFERPVGGTNDAPPPPNAGEKLRVLLGF